MDKERFPFNAEAQEVFNKFRGLGLAPEDEMMSKLRELVTAKEGGSGQTYPHHATCVKAQVAGFRSSTYANNLLRQLLDSK